MMRRTLVNLAATVAVAFGGTGLAAETGTLKAKFVYGGPPPVAAKVNVNKDVEFCGKDSLVDEKLLVNAKSSGIQNVVLYVFTGRGGTKLPEMPKGNKTHTLANDKCRFEPHIVVMQTGDSLNVTNPDEVGHNANMNFINNTAVNFQIPPKGEKVVKLDSAEPAPIPVECNIHPWMRAYVVVQDHPFVGVSNDNGEVEIAGLPVGMELAFRVYHEGAAGAIEAVKVNGKEESWKRNIFKVTIKEGVNDLGTIEIPAKAFGN